MVKWKYEKDLSRQGGTKQVVVVAKLATYPAELLPKLKRWSQMANRQLDFRALLEMVEHCNYLRLNVV